MFKEKDMTQAITWLINLFEPCDYIAYDDELNLNHVLCLSEICLALRNNAKTIYEYSINTDLEYGFNYCGKELFSKRACLIYEEMNIGVNDVTNTSYNTELWLLEDMSFVIVHSVDMQIGKGLYETQYRSIVKRVENRDDLFFSPEDLFEELQSKCIPIWEGDATIYELSVV